MKVLFVCQANVSRSQVAMELYRRAGGEADSAGTKVDTPGATLAERPTAANMLQIMREDFNLDLLNNVRTQITKENTEGYDKLVVMAEKETIPEWLLTDTRAEFWTIDDPKGQDMPTTKRIIGEVVEHLEPLLKDI